MFPTYPNIAIVARILCTEVLLHSSYLGLILTSEYQFTARNSIKAAGFRNLEEVAFAPDAFCPHAPYACVH